MKMGFVQSVLTDFMSVKENVYNKASPMPTNK